MTLENLYDEYMSRCAAHNRRPDKPKNNYRLYLSDWGNRKLSSIKPHDVQALHSRIGHGNGKVTANIALKLLHVMFNKAINEWHIWKGTNPVHGLKKFPEPSRDRFLGSDELSRFFKAVSEEDNPTMRDFFLMCLMTGARRSNVPERTNLGACSPQRVALETISGSQFSVRWQENVMLRFYERALARDREWMN